MDLRDEFMVKLRADAVLSEVGLRPELARRLQFHREMLARYQAIEARDFLACQALSRHAQMQHRILKKGMLYEHLTIA